MGNTDTVGGVTLYHVGMARLFAGNDVQKFADDIDQILEASAKPRVAIDLTGVEFVSSRTLGLIMAAYKKAQSKGGGLAIFGANATLVHVLDTTKINTVIPVVDAQDDVVVALSG